MRNVFILLALGLFAFGGLNPASAQSDLAKHTAPRPAQAAAPAVAGPLAPGGAAGIMQAQGQRNRIWTYAPFAVVSGLALLVVLATGDDDGTTSTATGTN